MRATGSYLNFVKPWTCVEGEFKHDVGTNVKQFGCWTKLYAASGATVPECWPKQVPTPVFFLGKSKRPSRAIVFLLFFAHETETPLCVCVCGATVR